QHAENPVEWHAWGEEAFAKARAADKPILLSIGYAACHWCHVMAHESFEDPAIAALMNEEFVNVKVDREERPDVDSLYMDAVVARAADGVASARGAARAPLRLRRALGRVGPRAEVPAGVDDRVLAPPR